MSRIILGPGVPDHSNVMPWRGEGGIENLKVQPCLHALCDRAGEDREHICTSHDLRREQERRDERTRHPPQFLFGKEIVYILFCEEWLILAPKCNDNMQTAEHNVPG